MEDIIKAIVFMLIITALIILGIILLPFIILLYIFLPKRPSVTWFNTFMEQARPGKARQKDQREDSEDTPDNNYYDEIPASQDIIDVSADEIEEKDKQS